MEIESLVYTLNNFLKAFAKLEQAVEHVVDDLDRDGAI